jgi:hypothetical protein
LILNPTSGRGWQPSLKDHYFYVTTGDKLLKFTRKCFLCGFRKINEDIGVCVLCDEDLGDPDIDHFYSKKEFPALSCHPANLVPICPIYMNELSEGMLRFLWLVSLLQSPNPSTITMIDEPEVSLHPELLSLLADLMREAGKRTQLIVATHSDRFIRFLEPKEVVVMDIDDIGYATATWADSLDIDRWLDEYSLDEVWRIGRMGGRS